MGDTKLCLLLLLCTHAFAQEDIGSAEEEAAPCLLAKRFKTLRNYVYQYETEALNGVSGASNLKNGAKASCKVEIDVPQTCSYIVRTPECTLSEVSDVDAEGLPVYGPAAGADAFQAAMALHPLKLTVEGESKVSLFPEEDEPINILNIKRGIISALLVPVLEEEKNKNMPTLHGLCKTDFAVNAREDIATDVTVTRHLSHCDGFSPKKDFASPLALISGLHIPLSKLISSTQTCNYKFDNEQKHMTEGTCTEKHILLPFSHQEQYGVLTLVKQTLALQETSKINDRVFDHNEANLKALQMEAVEDKSPVQTKDVILATLRELSTLSQTQQGKRRAHLFQKLVTEVRGLKSETLSPAVPEMVEVSAPLTWQALAQCGTPECSSAILQILRTMDKSAVEVDAVVYAVGLLPNPTSHLVQDMLSMAQYKQSKPILYGLSNIVRRVHQIEGKVTPEIIAVSEYMATLLGDCSGDKDQTFLTLRVIGNMGQAMEAANPALKSAMLQCMTQPAATPTVQQAAIQAFRKLTVTEEARGVLLQTVLDGASPVQKRVAAYLVLMKDPEPSDLAQVISALPDEQDPQAKSFVASHLANILSSTDPASLPMKEKITEALQGNEVPAALEFSKFSRNYKMSDNLKGNVIFDSTGYLPKEIMLETTLKAFGYDLDMLEVGLNGKGLEPTFEALFGQDGFFPDTLSKAVYWAGGNMPASVNTLLNKMIPPLNGRMKRQVPENILKEISHNVNKLVGELKTQSPDALVYLKLLGAELGFIKTNEMEEMAYSAALLADNLLKMFPTDIRKLISSIDNEFFIHYIFMDNEFSLPTASGVPLKVSLSGTLAPGAKGGLHLTPGLQEISFMPSVGVEFVTEMGVHIPEFVISGVAMHTNIYHESALNAKLALSNNQIKLTIPAPQGTTQLLEISNKLLSVTTTESRALPPITEERTDLVKCIPALPGIKSCITLKYPGSTDAAPYFPLTGETEVAVELEPTGQVTEYTATIAYELLAEGEVPEKVDALKILLVAEGAEPMEATAILKYNRNTNVLTTDVQIPDCDIEAGVRLGITDDSINGKGIMIEITHKNIPQVSLIGRAKLEAMKDGMLQVQLAIPSLKTDATVTAALKRAEDLTLEIESIINIPETSSLQKVTVRYDENQIEVELKSDLNSEVHKLLQNIDEYQKIIQNILDLTVTQTDMTVRHIVSKSIEATNIWLDRAVADAPVPIIESLRQIPELYLPEKLFLKSDSAVRYKFNQKHITIPISVPLGGKSSQDLYIPHTLTTPNLAVPQIGLVIPSTEVSIPTFSIPTTYELSLPLVEMEVSTKVNSNFYNLEGLASIDAPAKLAKYKVVGDCPMAILSYTIEGTGALTTTPEESLKAIVSSSLSHMLIDASVSLEGIGSIADKVHIITNSKMEASSPLGLETSLHYTTQSTLASDELAGDGNLDGTITFGSLYANATCAQSYMIYPFNREMRGESTLRVESTIFQANNRIKGSFANGELSVMSSTNLYNDILKHLAEVSFKDARLSVKSDAITMILGGTLRNQIELAASLDSASIRVESHADHTSNRAFSLLSGSLSTSGLEMNTEGSLLFGASRGSHKATLTFRNHKLTTSGTTTLQSSPLLFENVFSGGIDDAGTTLSIISKGSMQEMKIENTNTLALTLSSLAFRAQTDNVFSDSTSYKHDITVDIKPFVAAIKCSTTGKILGAHLIQNTDLDVAGLSSKFNNEIRFNTQVFRLDSTLRTLAAPFSLSVDSIFNSDGEMTLFGKHTGQLYSKLLLKAEPLAVAFSHDCRASTTHNLDIEASVETHFDNKIDSLLTPQEQRGTWRMKSKLNNHAYNQEINIYNQPERLGVELSGIVLTDILNKPANENQEFSISSFLKYDKNSNSHALMLPFIENLPAIFEQLKTSSVHVVESLKQYINREEIRTRLENLPEAVSDFVRAQDLENKVIEVKEKIVTLLQEYTVTPENFEAFLESIKIAIETIMNDVATRLKGIIAIIKETIEIGSWSDALSNIITTIVSELNAIDERYKISATIVSIITTVEDIIEQIDLEKLKDSSLAWLQELDVKYDIRTKLLGTVSQLKQAIESIDLAAFIQDIKNFVASLNVGGYIEQLVSEIPTETLIKLVDSIKRVIITCIQELNITDKVNAVYIKVREIIVEYEVDKKMEMLLEKVVELIKQFKIEDTVQAVVNTVKSIDLPALSDKAMQLLDDVVNHLKTLDIKQIIDLLNEYIDIIVKKLKSFDYNAFVDEVNPKITQITSFVNEQIQEYELPQKIEAVGKFVRWIQTSLLEFALPENSLPEIRLPDITIPKLNLENFDITTLQIPEITLPSIPSEIIVPAFGKLYGEIRLKSPHYNVRTSAELQNSTSNSMTPQLTAYLTSQATSTANIFEYVLDVTARVGFPKLSRIIVSETVKFTHTAASVEHQGSVTIYGLSAQASAKTTAKATTEIYTAELVNSAFFAIESGLSTSLDTTYYHNLNLELVGISSEATLTHKVLCNLEAGTIRVAHGTTGNGKWTFQDYTGDLTHKSDLDFTTNINSAKLTFSGNTDGQSLKMKQTLNADGILFKSITLNGRAETEAPFIKSSLVVVSGNVDMGDLKIELKGSHDTELDEGVSGTISNSINLLANPSEIIFDFQNKGNAKVDLPFSMSGKIDLQNDYAINLNTEVQQINWVALSRFNEDKYFHNLTLDNNKMETAIFATVNGGANLDFLTIPIDIPEFSVPFVGVQTPSLQEVSLWENAGLKTLLTTTEQTIDINLKLQYEKNPDMIYIGIDTLTIPTLGNLIFDLALKSPVFSLNANAGLQNQDDIIARLEASSTSLFDILKGKLDGTTTITRKKRGIKIATALSLEHNNVQGTNDIAINLNRRAMEASVATVAQVTLPILNLEFNQELLGSTKTKANVDSKMKLKYSFNLPLIDAIGKGDIEQSLALEGLPGHFYLDTSNKGKIEGTILASGNFAGALNNEANIHLDANGLRSSVRTDANSNGNSGETNIWSMDLNEDLALDASLNGLDVGLNLICNNEVNIESLRTKGKHVAKGVFELGPFAKLRANLDVDMSQPSSLGEASILQNIALEITAGKQKLSLKGKEQLLSVVHTYDLLLSNDLPEIRMEVSESIDGHAAVLKAIKLPIYQKTLWDVLKFDQATSEDDLQFVKGAIVAVCTKNQDGYIPADLSTTVKVSSPIYSTTLTASLENSAPAYTASLKSACTSTLAFLAYDLDATVTASIEDAALSLNTKGTFSHSDLRMDLQHVFYNILRKQWQDSPDAIPSRHILNVDITSPTFSDMSFRYASGKDRISTTISAPTSGFLGLRLSQSSARLYARYPSEPEKDVQILIFKKSQTALNRDAINDILLGLKERVPDITATLYNTVDKYHSALFDMDIESASHELKNTLSTTFEKAYVTATDFPEMSEFAILFKNLIDQYQNTIKTVVDAVIKFLRELQLQVPGFEEKLSLPELSHKIMSSVATVMDKVVQMINDYLEPYIDAINTYFSNIKVIMPGSDEALPASQVLENLKSNIKKIQNEIVGMVRHLESPDVILQKLVDLAEDCAKKTEELIGFLPSDTLDAVAAHINTILSEVLKLVKTTFETVNANMTLEQLNDSLQYLIETIRTPVSKITSTSTNGVAPAAEEVPAPEDVEAPEEVPASEDVPAAEEVPTVEEVPVAEEVPGAEDVPAAEEVPGAEDAPAAEEVPAAEDVPAAEEVPAAEDVPAAEEVPAAEDVPAAEEVPAADEVVADMGEMSTPDEH